MKALSALGGEAFFLVLFPFLYWCLDSRLGLRLGLVYSLSALLNHGLKEALGQPRPADLAPGIALVQQHGYGLPSAHAQGAVVLWGLLAREAARRGAGRWPWAPSALLMLGVGLSRVYLGVHFPTDVLAGWALGGLVLGAAAWAFRRAPARPVGPAEAPRARGLLWWAWLPASGLAAAGALFLWPEKDAVAMVSAAWGFLTGHFLRRRLDPGAEGGGAARRLLRLPVGLAVLLALYLGLERLAPGEGRALYLPLRAARYLLCGAWASLGAPLLFRRIGLQAQSGG